MDNGFDPADLRDLNGIVEDLDVAVCEVRRIGRFTLMSGLVFRMTALTAEHTPVSFIKMKDSICKCKLIYYYNSKASLRAGIGPAIQAGTIPASLLIC